MKTLILKPEMTRVAVVISFLILVCFAGDTAAACSLRASYQSVVLNSRPASIPPGAKAFKVEILFALFTPGLDDMKGIRGVILPTGDTRSARKRFEVTGSVGSMCNTWIEAWSSDHQIKERVLTGYIVGYERGKRNKHTIIEPILFQSATDRANGQLRRSETLDHARRIDPASSWRPFRVDPKAFESEDEPSALEKLRQ